MQHINKIQHIISDTDKNYAAYYDVIPGLIAENNFQNGIEIGVFAGGHALKMLEKGVFLLGIDPYKEFSPGMPAMDSQQDYDLMHDMVMSRLENKNFDSKGFYVHYRMTSDQAFEKIKNYEFDFVFIDGLHTYDQLKKDLENYSTLIRKGGVIACHDYNHPFFPDLTTCIDEFVAKHNKQLVIGPMHLVYFYW